LAALTCEGEIMVRAHALSMCRSFVVFAFVASCTLNIAASTTQEKVVQVPNNVDERTKELEAEMAPLASDMWATLWLATLLIDDVPRAVAW
jgi:hypothetical protein